MRLKLVLVTLLCLFSVLPLTHAFQQQPSIASFETTATEVTRTELSLNTARIPVSWEVLNRPPNSNLVFEQVFTDGRVQNVELPRSFTIVPSSGVGVVAPANPGDDEIVIQIRLIDVNSQAVYAQDEFTLPISDAPVQGPSIQSFTAGRTSVSQGELNTGVRIPVSWRVVDYLPQSNLVFEQVLANGQAVNVELPRSFVIVPPQGDGIVAPVLPGGDSEELVLQLRAVDLLESPRVEGGVFDEQQITIEITESPEAITPKIDSFSLGQTTPVSRADLEAGQVRIPVSWSVSNRPPNSNLVFEQTFSNGTFQNVELPRNFTIIPSAGDGVVAPVVPINSNEIALRLRVLDLGSNQTLASREITYPVSGGSSSQPSNISVASGAECLRRPYRPTNGIGQAETGTVAVDFAVSVFDAPASGNVTGELSPGAGFTVLDSSPTCYQIPGASNNQLEYRLWHVRSDDGTDGWVNEYTRNLLGMTYLIQPSDSVPSVDVCLSVPYPPDQGIRVGSKVVVTSSAPADGLSMSVVNDTGQPIDQDEFDALKPGGMLTVIGGPVCRSEGDTTFGPIRQWLVRTESGVLQGWVFEHRNVPGDEAQFLLPSN